MAAELSSLTATQLRRDLQRGDQVEVGAVGCKAHVVGLSLLQACLPTPVQPMDDETVYLKMKLTGSIAWLGKIGMSPKVSEERGLVS